MKLRAATLATCIGFLSAPVLGQSNLDLPIEAAWTYIPTPNNYDYRMLSAEAAAGLNFGCEGVSLEGSLMNSIDGYSAMAGQVVANAPMLAVNALIYSSPSLYALIQNLKESFETNLGGSNMSCNLARSLGKSAWADNPEAVAYDECMSQKGGMHPDCINMTNPTVGFVLTKRAQWRDNMETAVQDFEAFFGACESIDSDSPTLMAMVLSKGSGKCEDMTTANELFIDVRLDTDTGEIKRVAPDKTYSDVAVELTDGYLDAINEIVDQNTEDFHNQEPYISEIRAKHHTEISYSQHRMLQDMKANAPASFAQYVRMLAVLYTVTDLEDLSNRIAMGIAQGRANTETSLFPGEETEYLMAQVDALREYADSLRERLSNQNEESKFLDSGYRILRNEERN